MTADASSAAQGAPPASTTPAESVQMSLAEHNDGEIPPSDAITEPAVHHNNQTPRYFVHVTRVSLLLIQIYVDTTGPA